MSADLFLSSQPRIQRSWPVAVRVPEDSKRPTMHRTYPVTKTSPTPRVKNAAVEKPDLTQASQDSSTDTA